MLRNRELIETKEDLQEMLFLKEMPYLKDAKIIEKKLIKTNIAYMRAINTGSRADNLVAAVGHYNSGYFDCHDFDSEKQSYVTTKIDLYNFL